MADMIMRCCKYSQYAYAPHMISQKRAAYLKCSKNTNTRGLLVQENKRVFVSFKGSNSIMDLMEAAKVMPVETKYGLIHKGFWKQYVSIKNQLLDELAKIDNPRHVYFTGHSMGGCIAMMCAIDAMEVIHLPSVTHCYMFGSPAFCNADVVQHTIDHVHDWVCVDLTGDLVAQVPLNPVFVKPKEPHYLKIEAHGHTLIDSHSCLTYYKAIKKTFS